MGILKLGESYKVTDVSVRNWAGKKYLSTTESSKVEQIENLPDVLPEEIEGRDDYSTEGEIVGIQSIDEYLWCIMCKGKVSELNQAIGQCSKCGTKQKLVKCIKNVAARIGGTGDVGLLASFPPFVYSLKGG